MRWRQGAACHLSHLSLTQDRGDVAQRKKEEEGETGERARGPPDGACRRGEGGASVSKEPWLCWWRDLTERNPQGALQELHGWATQGESGQAHTGAQETWQLGDLQSHIPGRGLLPKGDLVAENFLPRPPS